MRSFVALGLLALALARPTACRADGTVAVVERGELGAAWRAALGLELASTGLAVVSARSPTFRVGLLEGPPARVYAREVGGDGFASTPVTATDDPRTLALVAASLLEELGAFGPSRPLGDPSYPGPPPAEPRAPDPPPRPPPREPTGVYLGFDSGALYLPEYGDGPWGLMSRVSLGHQLHEWVRLGAAVDGGALFESFGHAQPFLRPCLEVTLTVPTVRRLFELRVGAEGCLSAARFRYGSQDRWTGGAAVGGHVAFALRLTRMLDLGIHLDAGAWGPDAISRPTGEAPRDWAAMMSAGLGTELHF